MKKTNFNIIFLLITFFTLTLSIFLFPNYQRIPNGLGLQLLSLGLYLSVIINIEIFFPNKIARLVIGSCFFLLSFYYLLDAFSLYYSSYHFSGLVEMTWLGGDLLTALREVGIEPVVAYTLALIPIATFLMALKFHRFTDRHTFFFNKKFKLTTLSILALFALLFIGEQTLNKESATYFLRSNTLPLYWQLNHKASQSYYYSASPGEKDLQLIISEAQKASTPQNILLVVLEGVPSHMVNKANTPFLYSFSKESLDITNAMTEATATHLALNSLLFNRPAYSFENDIKKFSEVSSAALPFEVLKKSGYEIFLGVSTDFSMKSDEVRALGKRKTVDHYFRGFDKNYIGRNVTDNLVATKALDWITGRKGQSPFVMTLQFDCTHWPYEFDEINAIHKPYLMADRLDKFDSESSRQLVINRYKNSLKQLDVNLEKIIKNLRSNSATKNTIIAVISDHGETFGKGHVTHLNLNEETKKITYLVSFPDKKHNRIEGFVGHRDFWAMIFESIGIKFNGKNPFNHLSAVNKKSLLTVNGNLQKAELTYADKVIHFNLKVDSEKITLSPILITDRMGNIQSDWQNKIESIDWMSEIKKSIY